jgi:HSP20 family molecular chaperone IbpA
MTVYHPNNWAITPYVQEFSEYAMATLDTLNVWEAFNVICGAYPPTNIDTCSDSVIITMDIPGLQRNQFNVLLEPGCVVVTGRRIVTPSEGYTQTSHERKSGTFTRKITVPFTSSLSDIDASYRDGILLISVGKHGITNDIGAVSINFDRVCYSQL